MREYAPSPRTYELMTILSPEVPEEEIAPSLETIAGYIRNENGVVFEVLRDAPWGRRRFAYPIRYHNRDVRDGYYTVFHFEAIPAAIGNIDRELKLNDRIMRYIIVKYELSETEPRPEEIRAGDLLRAAEPAPGEAAAPVPAGSAAESPAEGEETPAAAEAEAPVTAGEPAQADAATVQPTEAAPVEEAPGETPATEVTEGAAAPAEEAPAPAATGATEVAGSEAAPAEETAAPSAEAATAEEEAPAPAEAAAPSAEETAAAEGTETPEAAAEEPKES